MSNHASHPRPDRFRQDWWSQDGAWDFAFDDADQGLERRWFEDGPFEQSIEVPFAHQAPASGVGDAGDHRVLWYRRRVLFPALEGGRLLLHFGAVDYACQVFLDGEPVGQHTGGYVPFCIDVSPFGDREAVLCLRVVDQTAHGQPRGKQIAPGDESSRAFRGIRYTACSGIWQPVWIERAGRSYLKDFRVGAGADGRFELEAEVAGDTEACDLDVQILLAGERVARFTGDAASAVRGRLPDVRAWSPDSPVLYDLHVSLRRGGELIDRVESRVGFRTIETRDGQILLNGEPLVLRLVLDQGYWPEGLTTPPSEDAIRRDVEWLRAAGFNGVRKHQKLEDPRFWRWADELGLLVWQDLPAASFEGLGAEPYERAMQEWEEGIRRDRNHPAAICFSPFNESWGVHGVRADAALQERLRDAATRTRALAPDALVVDNSGWHHLDTDLLDLHNYVQDPEQLDRILGRAQDSNYALEWKFEFEAEGDARKFAGEDGWVRHDTTPLCDGVAYEGQPVVLSEFGGTGCVLEGDARHPDRFVYHEAGTPEELAQSLLGLIGVAEQRGLAGWCWTQLSDIEQEENGLLTYDRREKLPAAQIAQILARAAARRPR